MYQADLCIGCGCCKTGCPTGALTDVGQEFSVEKLANLLCRDRIVFDTSGGGVTLSGGEVMAQDMRYILPLCMSLKHRGISVMVDTCGHVPYDRFEQINPYVDTYLYDLKMMNEVEHKAYTGVDNRLILSNLEKLSADGARIILRIPIIPGVNDGEEETEAAISFCMTSTRVRRINLLPYHHIGSHKAGRLCASPPWLAANNSGGSTVDQKQKGTSPSQEKRQQFAEFKEPTEQLMSELRELWLAAGCEEVLVGGE